MDPLNPNDHSDPMAPDLAALFAAEDRPMIGAVVARSLVALVAGLGLWWWWHRRSERAE
ncbi:MAG: hypothetical protein ACKOYM_07690 [Actinomycetes bacterium]